MGCDGGLIMSISKLLFVSAICFLLLFSCFSVCSSKPLAIPQTFENTSRDTGEAPRINRVNVSVSSHDLILRFEGKLELGRQMDALRKDWGKFHHSDTTLLITINNEALVDSVWSVGPDSKSGDLVVKPSDATVSAKDDAVTVSIPLKKIIYSPVMLTAEIKRTYYISDNMAGGEGRNLFGITSGPALFSIPSLPMKAPASGITGLKTDQVTSDSMTLKWRSANRTDAKVVLKAAGSADRVVSQSLLLNSHRLTINDLKPNTAYTVSVSGKDVAGRPVKGAPIRVRTHLLVALKGQDSFWLSVRGTQIVDASGKPFPLGGYSSFPGEIWFDQIPRYGTHALAARYFRSMGLNSCRLGLSSRMANHWAAGIERDEELFKRFGGPEGYVKKYLRPMVDQITGEGIYVIIDWHWSYSMTHEYVEQIGKFWEAAAKEFKDNPKVAVYQLLNEPSFKIEGGTTPDIAPLLRKITKDYIARIRKYDKRHIILVPDWNSGWGWATENQWSPVNFDTGDPQRQVVFSKHVAKEHMTDAFMAGGVDSVMDKWNVPVFFDEVECGELMGDANLLWFFNYLNRNPRVPSFAIWVAGQYGPEYPMLISAFAKTYLRPAPFGATGESPIVNWWYLDKVSSSEVGGKWYYRFAVPKELPAGDYGVSVLGVDEGVTLGVAVEAQPDGELQGVYLGNPTVAGWRTYTVTSGQSAVDRATYIHPLSSYREVVIRSAVEIKEPKLQLFHLNPKHQHPVPVVETTVVN